jgi:ergothioneine biosynthesis protein EgtB
MSAGKSTTVLDRGAVLDRFSSNRRRTRALFDVLDDSVYYERPIALRNPVVFYEGHVPVFAVNTFVRKALGWPGIDAHFETIFARGIDPDSEATAIARGNPAWPSQREVRAYGEEADRLIEKAIDAAADLDGRRRSALDPVEALGTILEHEEMHQETLAYIWHQVPYARKRRPSGYDTCAAGTIPSDASSRVRIPAGTATLGTDSDRPFAWDNERPPHQVEVDAFAIDVHNVTNAQFLEFVDAGGYQDARWWRPEDWAWVSSERVSHPRFWTRDNGRWWYRAMFDRVPLPEAWPVYVTWAEANAFAVWRGLRLPAEAEYHRAAFGDPGRAERLYPWGQSMTGRAPGNFDFERWDPEPVGARPEGASAFGVHDLIGNGWEWTSTIFGPFEGFMPLPSYPEYSADFFDGDHFVMKGASPLTSRSLVRRGFRNWFRPRYPYVYATFRCVETL